ncbi:hypothetical protein BDL97_03G078000 [Sphagnum fallax]|nr:hypothetical protein BDL97_03G078000 [Sphagnum fallax]
MDHDHGSLDFNMYRELSMTNLCSLAEEESSSFSAAEDVPSTAKWDQDQTQEAASRSSPPSPSSSPGRLTRKRPAAAATSSSSIHSPSSSISFPALYIDIIPDDCNSPRREYSTDCPAASTSSTAAASSGSCSTTTSYVTDQADAAARWHTMPSIASCATRIEPRGTPVIGETIWSPRGSYNRPNDLVVVVDDETYMSDDSMSSQVDDPWNAEDKAFDEENVRHSCEQLESSLHARHDVLAFDGRTGRTTVDHAGKEQSFFNCDAAADAAAKLQLQEAAASQEKGLEFDTATSRASSQHAASRICSVVRTRRSWSQPASPVAATEAYKLSITPDRTKQFSGPLPRLHHHLHSLVVSGGGGGSPKIHDPAIDEFTATASSPVPTPRRSGNYGLFRTRSASIVNPGRIHLEPDELNLRSPSPLHGRHGEIEEEEEFGWSDFAAQEAAPAVSPGRYFDALEGPELEKPKDSEDLLLPSDELWPFLLRFPIGVFRISLGLGCQSILWRDLHELQCMQRFVYVPYVISEVIWWLALATLLLLTIIYIAKCVVYYEAVRREFYHPVRVNYFFTPWITALFLAQTVPQYLSFNTTTSTKSTTPLQLSGPSPALWCVVMTPILALDLKLYGQWLSGGERRLSKVANPSTHMSVVGNFAGAKVAALVGWREAAILFWAVGLAHYLVLFVTLYQRLPTNVVLPKEMHPVYFLFVAVPASASVAWRYITGRFGNLCKILFFISLFLYSSLVFSSMVGIYFSHVSGCNSCNPLLQGSNNISYTSIGVAAMVHCISHGPSPLHLYSPPCICVEVTLPQ